MASPKFLWDAAKRAFKDSAAGRFIQRRQLTKLRDDLAETATAQMGDLAAKAARGEITPAAFEQTFRELVRNVNGAQYLLGRGGVNQMGAKDFRDLSKIVADQQSYVPGFRAAIEAGVSEAAASARAALYAGAGVAAHDRGLANAWGLDLPVYPAEDCLGLGRCRCNWSIVDTGETVEATWVLGGASPCEVCAGHATEFNPLVFPKEALRVDAIPVRFVRVAA